jgi:hypothetical protein
VNFLGGVTDVEKAVLLKSVDIYVAPQTGGESFGIVLVEAMSAGAAVVASDLGAFRRVLKDGEAGTLFRTDDATDLERAVVGALQHPAQTAAKRDVASVWVNQYDWATVTSQIETVYDMVVQMAAARPGGKLTDRWFSDAGREYGRSYGTGYGRDYGREPKDSHGEIGKHSDTGKPSETGNEPRRGYGAQYGRGYGAQYGRSQDGKTDNRTGA